MLRARYIVCLVLILIALVLSAQATKNTKGQQPAKTSWRETFTVDKANLVDTGRNT